MTLGEGILWSTVLILTAAAVCQVSIRRWWKTVGKVFGVQVLIGGIIGAGVWGWFEYQDRPYVVEELNGFRLGMVPAEVLLAKGKPENYNEEPVKEGDKFILGWSFQPVGTDPILPLPRGFRLDRRGIDGHWAFFSGDSPNEMELDLVCEYSGFTSVLSIKPTTSEDSVIKKLGQPSNESIRTDGLAKFISYEQWNVMYEIEKGQVFGLCIISSGRASYFDKYEEEQAERAE